MSTRNVYVVGGGLAGMTVAKELMQRANDAVNVTILESTQRLGGKAGADTKNGNDIEHGYHVFPGWYANTRALLKELNVLENLVDIRQIHYLSTDGGLITIRDAPWGYEGIRNLLHDIFHGPISWREMLLLMNLMLDLANEPWRYKSFLDLTTANAFLGSRLLATEKIAKLQHCVALQGVSIASYELSAMTLQKVTRAWFRYPSPIFSIFKGNLQHEFITPFENLLRKSNVNLSMGKRVCKLHISSDNAVGCLEFMDGTFSGQPDDIYVLATPPEVTVNFVDDTICDIEQDSGSQEGLLSELTNLHSAPMAAMYLTLRRPPTLKGGAELPREHVVLRDSQFLTSFIDLSNFWEGLRDAPTLSIIASNMAPVLTICDPPRSTPDIQPLATPAAQFILAEMREFLDGLEDANIDAQNSYARFNLNEPLFLNTVGSWLYRPRCQTRLGNLYIAGDYCRTEADLTTMESAVISGLSTANRILSAIGRPPRPVLSLKTDAGWNPWRNYPRLPLRFLQWSAFPLMLVLFLSLAFTRHEDGRFRDALRAFFR